MFLLIYVMVNIKTIIL